MTSLFIVCISILLLTSFVKVITCMSILRYGLGLYGSGFGFVFFALSLVTSLYIASPYVGSIDDISSISSYSEIQKKFKPFLEKNISNDIKEKFKILENTKPEKEERGGSNIEGNQQNQNENIELQRMSFLFMVSQIRDALKYGVIILLPFLIIDLLVMNIFMSLGVKDFPYLIASLPLKLGVFVSVDGIVIITEKLINFYT